MTLLAIDTAGPNCAVALFRSRDKTTELLARQEEEIGRGHAERLFPLIETALAEAGLRYADLSAVATTIGPGSFTGIRIGVAAARGLALSLKIDAFGIDTLQALIAAARPAQDFGVIAALLDAGRGNLYLRAEESGGDLLIASGRTSRQEAAALLAPFAQNRLALVGGGAAAILAAGIDGTILAEPACADIGVVAQLTLAGHGISPPSPLYLRPPDAKPQHEKALARQ